MRLVLNHDAPGLEMTPKDYEFSLINPTSTNTFLFSEKDLPGYKPGVANNFRASQRTDRIQKSGGGRGGRGGKRSIPKRTSLVGFARHEFSLHPIENKEYERVQRLKEEAQRRSEATVGDILETSGRRLDDLSAGKRWQGFTAKQRKDDKKKRQLEKAQRMPPDQLMDLLVTAFHEYPYWGFKTLVQRVHQPEAYVKDMLGKVAELIKTGPFANTYRLREEYRKLQVAGAQFWESGAVAPEAQDEDTEGNEDDAKDEGDDEDGPMEDVL